MDAVYVLILAGLYLVTHGLVWAMARLGESDERHIRIERNAGAGPVRLFAVRVAESGEV